MSALVPCDAHDHELAAWTCGDCRRALCPRCAAEVSFARVKLVRCMYCNGVARLLLVPPTLKRWWTLGPEMRAALTSIDGVLQIAAVAGLMYLFQLIPVIGGVFAFATLTSYLLLVVRHASEGGVTLPEPDDRSGSTVRGALMRAFFASLVLWLPGVLFLLGTEGIDGLEAWPSSFKHPRTMVLIGLAGLALFPASIVVASTSETILAMVNPWSILRLFVREPLQYTFAWAGCAGLCTLASAVGSVSMAVVARLPIPIVLPFLAICLTIVPVIVAGLVLGRFVYENGLGHTSVGWQPQVPGATPRGVLPDGHRRPPDVGELPVDRGMEPPPEAEPWPAAADEPVELPTDWSNKPSE